MQNNTYNPDVLSCLANLSNDEVFTPPALANQMLDLLPNELWSNPDAKFLDPCCKSGVFLREIAKRLIIGLKSKFPDLQERLNHIYTNQLYGIAITEMTALLSRRSVYCSKTANGKYSVCDTFKDSSGNIVFQRTEHTWVNGRCQYCGASQSEYDRDESLETHAYQFIHAEQVFNMKFDVIIGNPPYQLSLETSGQKEDSLAKSSAIPIYQKFIQQAKLLEPRYLTMIIPSRWFSGGRGLDAFRKEMLTDNHIRVIHDFFNSTECFAGVDISGGVCYFLRDKDNPGQCEFVSHTKNATTSAKRDLSEFGEDKFVRFNEALSILHKILPDTKVTLDNFISAQNPFGLNTNFRDFNQKNFPGSIKLFAYPNGGYISKNQVLTNVDLVQKWKVFTAKAYGERGEFPYLVLGKPFIGGPGTACTATYRIMNTFNSEQEAVNFISYVKTKFFRFLVLLIKNTQDAPTRVYSFVPMQDFNESWDDKKLYKKYGLNQKEIAFIESMVRPME